MDNIEEKCDWLLAENKTVSVTNDRFHESIRITSCLVEIIHDKRTRVKREKKNRCMHDGGPSRPVIYTRMTGQLSPLSTRAHRIYTSAKSLTRATELPVAHCARVTSLPQFANRRCRNPPATLVYREISELRGRVHTYVLYKIRRRGFRGTNEIYAVSGTRNLRGWKVVG